MPTFAEAAAAGTARGGGVPAQLQMGRDKIVMAQFATQQAAKQRATEYASQQDMARMQLDREKMAAQQAQFEASQGLQREKMGIQQGQFGQEFGLREGEAGREQQLQEMDIMERQREQGVDVAMGVMYGEMDLEGTTNAYLQTPGARYINSLDIDPATKSMMWDRDFDQWSTMQKTTGVGRGPTGRPAAALQIAKELRDTRQKIVEADASGNTQEAMALRSYYNELTGSQKIFEKGFAPMGLEEGVGGGAAPGVLEFEEERAGAKARGAGEEAISLQKVKERPKDELALRTLFDNNELVNREIEKTRTMLKEQMGLGRVLLQNIPLTDAKALKASIGVILNNIAFDKLSGMREASKTGGAVGQLTDDERRALGSLKGALEADLPFDYLITVLDQIIEFRGRAFDNRTAKFNSWYGDEFIYSPGGGAVGVGGAPTGGAAGGVDYSARYGLE